MPEKPTNANLLTVAQASAEIAVGNLSSRDLVGACLDQIARRDESVKAWQFVSRTAATGQAEKIDGSSEARLLRGIPIGIKDVIDTSDMPTTYGSSLYQEHRPSADAACVARLRAAGAVIMGKTVSTEFAYLQPAKTANPHNLAHTPGGSSSGSAAAVAACMVPVALATQTAGSCIRPAAYCGIFGFKPTFGLFDTTGIMPLAQSLDTLSLMARSIQDISITGAALSERLQIVRNARPPRSMKIAFATLAPEWSQIHPDAYAIYQPIQRKLSDAGISFTDIDLGETVAGLHELHRDIMSFEAAGNFGEHCDQRGEQVSAPIRGLVEHGRTISPGHFDQKQKEAARRRNEVDDILADWDVILTPSAPGSAPPLAAGTGLPTFNSFWTLLHVPCLTIPVLKTASGLPLGIQLAARRGEDNALLNRTAFLSNILCER